MPPSPATVRALLATSGVVLVAGAALAVAKPGNLDDESSGGADSAAQATTTTSFTSSTAATAATATTVLPGPSETTLTVPADTSGGTGGTATTQGPGSGLGTDGPSVADDATATTGIESMLGPGLALVAAAAAARAAARRRTPA